MSPVAILSLLLALSVAGNAWLFHSRDKSLAEASRVEQLAMDTRAAADACTQGVTDLEVAARRRHEATQARLAAIAGPVASLQAASIESLNARPADPADLCRSVELFLRGQIHKERGK